jgi:hypothetical protein
MAGSRYQEEDTAYGGSPHFRDHSGIGGGINGNFNQFYGDNAPFSGNDMHQRNTRGNGFGPKN